jgi:MoxR-like ATPase
MADIQDPKLRHIIESLDAGRAEIKKVIRGQESLIDMMLTALLAGGHALLEGVPGTAKTLSVRTLALTLSCRAKRVQFTPDLMPSDILGTTVFTPGSNEFHLHEGPIFTDLLLADEINRAPAKTQSALLEAMSERHVTIDGQRHLLSPVFTVFATQNPVEFEGTYPLPEAQQDRFLLKIPVDYPDDVSERELLNAIDQGHPPDRLETSGITAVLTVDQLATARDNLAMVRVEPAILEYLMSLVRATRKHESIVLGGGPRASIALLTCSKAWALIHGRDFVTPDDIARLAEPVLAHRITLSADAEVAGTRKMEVLGQIMESLEVPR